MPVPLSLIPGLFKYYDHPSIRITKAELERVSKMTPIDVIMECLDEKTHSKTLSKVYLLLAGTGTGKSSALPVYLYHHITRSILIT